MMVVRVRSHTLESCRSSLDLLADESLVSEGGCFKFIVMVMTMGEKCPGDG